MTEPELSASKAALLAGCQYAFRPGVVWICDRGRSAVQGDQFHKAIAPHVDPTIPHWREQPTTKWHRARMEHAMAWLAANRTSSMRAEVAYAYDPEADTARVLGYNIGREYKAHGLKLHEIGGSADIASVEGNHVFVDDFKTGRFVTVSVYPQLEWLGLFAARAHGATHAIVRALHVTESGVDDRMARSLDADDLDRIAAEIRQQRDAIADAWPTPGAHCDGQYCPARASCELYLQRSA